MSEEVEVDFWGNKKVPASLITRYIVDKMCEAYDKTDSPVTGYDNADPHRMASALKVAVRELKKAGKL